MIKKTIIPATKKLGKELIKTIGECFAKQKAPIPTSLKHEPCIINKLAFFITKLLTFAFSK